MREWKVNSRPAEPNRSSPRPIQWILNKSSSNGSTTFAGLSTWMMLATFNGMMDSFFADVAIRAQRGDPSGWREFIAHLHLHHDVAIGFIRVFERLGWAAYSIENDCMELTLPDDFATLDDATKKELISILNPILEVDDESPKVDTKGEIMYIEEKPGLAGHARIGRVTFSATRKTIYYAAQTAIIEGCGIQGELP